ncbi:MAG: DUF2155 domain-containing protein [Alphaproteobacteria bacterium]|jgi:hypothetical protein|nr:DUF2155 domain-containing protein [Alphaproteobacteria bacterium]
MGEDGRPPADRGAEAASQTAEPAEKAAGPENETANPEDRSRTWNKRQIATLRGLDKITGRYQDFQMKVGEPHRFGSLRVHLRVCFQTPPEEVPESAAFLQIDSLTPMSEALEEPPADEAQEADEEEPRIFSGWMFASSPGLNALEHPVYDIWVIECAPPPPMPAVEEDE